MLILDCFGKNVIIDGKIVGYIKDNAILVNGRKFADLSDDGVIAYGETKIGYVDEDGYIYINEKEVGYIDEQNNFVLYKPTLK